MDNDSTRKQGFYWVELNGRWVVAEWFPHQRPVWLFSGVEWPKFSNELNEIDENRIERNE